MQLSERDLRLLRILAPSGKVRPAIVGNAWDPHLGRETPWLDLAHQLAGPDGIAALGPAARAAPWTEALGRLFEAAGGRVLIPRELWNRFGSNIIPKLRSADQLQASVELTVEVEGPALNSLEMEIQQILSDLDLGGKVAVEKVGLASN